MITPYDKISYFGLLEIDLGSRTHVICNGGLGAGLVQFRTTPIILMNCFT